MKRLTAEEFEQTHLMRRVLETEVIRAMPPLSEELLTRLTELNREIGRAGDRADYTTIHQLNVEFHFLIFQTSGLGLVVDELRRIWTLSGVYRSAYLAYDHDARCRTVGEHDDMVEALRRNDAEHLVELMDRHRIGTRAQVRALLARTTPTADGRGVS